MHVPKVYPDNPALGRFVVKVRSWNNKNNVEKLTPSRRKRLDKIGFVWDPKKDPEFWKVQQGNIKADEWWEQNFQSLLKFKNEKGHCIVPKEYPPDQVRHL